MSVYLVSTKRFAAARARLAASTASRSTNDASASVLAIKPEPLAESVRTGAPTTSPTSKSPRKSKRKAAEVEAVSEQPPTAAGATASTGESDGSGELVGAGLAGTVEELLQLPRAQVGALLASCDEPIRKVFLALIYRLAAVEDELRGVSAKLRSSGVRAMQSATFRAPSPGAEAATDKSGLLEQVFQKNVSLRNHGP